MGQGIWNSSWTSWRKINSTSSDFNNILDNNFEQVFNTLKDSKKQVGDIKGSIGDVKDDVSKLIYDNSDIIEDYGKLGFKATFYILGGMNIAIAAFMLLICMCSGKMCQNCCCCRCICKLFTHLLWNILALLMIIVFLIGSLFTLIGTVGGDVVTVVTYVISIDNLGDGKENAIIDQIGEDAKNYINRCINSDGKIVFTNDNGESNTYTYVYDDNSKYSTEMRVILINQIFEEKVYQVPYACEIGNTTLKLHYFGPYFTDHIPETFVYKRIK